MPAKNTVAPDELQAHTGMFSGKSNDGYYQLGLETVKLVREAVMLGRGIFEDPDAVNADLKDQEAESQVGESEKQGKETPFAETETS